MKKLLAMVLALVMTLSLAVSANAAFKDDTKISDDYAEAVAVLNGMGVFKGYEDGSFKPEGNITMRKAFHIFAEVIAFIFSATILVFGGFQVSQLAMGQQTSSLGVAVGVFYWVMPICGVIILVYSVLNIIGIANGSICLDTPEDADFAKVEAEMAADADKENKED